MEVTSEGKWGPGCGGSGAAAWKTGLRVRHRRQHRTGARSRQKQLREAGDAEMSLLLPPPGQITRRKKCFTGHEVSHSLV